ncbi:MAG: UDP-glucose 4-epimerase GalE, partial [Planctomycetes bacterium]|nr:UDP-glucose 4-epimerase GalE [Planctomycetota bacterium]
GGCGYIGSETARHLARCGHQICVVDNLSEGHRAAWDGEFHELELLDVQQVNSLATRPQTFDGIIHFAARAYVGESVEQPLRYWRANLVPVLNLCQAFPGVPFVFSSTCATYGNPETPRIAETHPQEPVNPYGASKLAAERLLLDRMRAGQGACALLRYFNAAGASSQGDHGEHHDPESHLIPLAIQAALHGEPILQVFGNDWDTPDGTCVRDYIHVEDLARAHLRALEYLLSGGDSGAWNLGTGRGSSVLEVLDAVEQAVGAKVPHTLTERRAGDSANLVADPSLAAKELEWSAQHHGLLKLVEDAVSWHRNHPMGYSK